MSIEHRWSFPNDMHRTYTFLFETTHTLRVQMSPDLWQLVYNCAAARDRSVAWAEGLGYTRRHMLASERELHDEYAARMSELRENEIRLDEQTLGEAVRRQEKAIRMLEMRIARNRLMWFDPPQRTEDPVTGSRFEVQSDSFYCAVHALNNIARSVLFAPPDILSAIECTRTLDERCASPEDVMLMALREGVFLLQLNLSDVADADQLSGGQNFAALLGLAGGMLVYQPGGAGGVGHYVPLVRIRDQWVIFSGDSVHESSASASDTLHRYIARTANIAVPPGVSAAEARLDAAAALAPGSDPLHFIGLLPIGLDCLWQEHNRPGAVLQTIMARTLLRRALSEWRLQPLANDGVVHQDVWTATPLSPCAIEEIGSLIFYEPQLASVRCTGFETVNAASFVGSRHDVYRELNRYAERLAYAVRRNKYSQAIELLRQLRSYLRSPPALDCLFMSDAKTAAKTDSRSMPGVAVRSGYASALMSNRRWLRLVALSLASDAVLTQGECDGAMTAVTFRLTVLICLLCYTNLTVLGVPVPAELAAIWSDQSSPEHWRDSLPCERAMPPAIRDAYFGRPGGLAEMCSFVSYDASLWLLRAAANGLRGFAMSGALLAALHMPPGTAADTNRAQFDQQAALVGALRRTLFRLPLAGEESAHVAVTLREQWCFESAELARHNRAVANEFMTECTRLLGADANEVARSAIDVLAFDTAYLGDDSGQRPALQDAAGRPRFLELAAQSGFVHMHRRSFGRIDSNPGYDRQPALDNSERIDLPHTPGIWYTARVRSNAQRLAVAPLSHLGLQTET